jgi:hypothetical protein
MPVLDFILCDLWTYVTFGRAVAICLDQIRFKAMFQTGVATTYTAGGLRHFALCEAPHTLAWVNRASIPHAGCEMGCNQLMT